MRFLQDRYEYLGSTDARNVHRRTRKSRRPWRTWDVFRRYWKDVFFRYDSCSSSQDPPRPRSIKWQSHPHEELGAMEASIHHHACSPTSKTAWESSTVVPWLRCARLKNARGTRARKRSLEHDGKSVSEDGIARTNGKERLRKVCDFGHELGLALL